MKRSRAFTVIEVMFVMAIIAIIAMLVVDVRKTTSARDAFMEQCLKDRKEYECVAMWRAGGA